MLREEAILSSLKKLDYLSRRQIQELHNLSGDRNAIRVLNGMREFISSFRCETGENIYYLNKSGRERTGAEVVRTRTAQVGHYLMRADAYIYYKDNEDWKNEMRMGVKDVVVFVTDAYFRHNSRRHFLEVDHLQHMSKNMDKIAKCKKFKDTGVMQEKIKYFPKLVWVTLTENRRKQLIEACQGLDVVVHLWDEIK